MRSRRARNSTTIASTSSCGPTSASTAPTWANVATPLMVLMISWPYVADERRRHDRVAHPPAGHRERLGEAVEDDRPLGHPGQRGDRDVLGAVVQDPAVDLVGEDPQVVLDGERGDPLEVAAGQHAAGRVGRRVDDEDARPRRDERRPARRRRGGSRSPSGSGSAPASRRRTGSATRRSDSRDPGRAPRRPGRPARGSRRASRPCRRP